MHVYTKECEHVGVDPKKVRSIARRIQRAMKDADDLGIYLFGGTWNATLRSEEGQIIVAEMNGCYTSGGCGAQRENKDGLMAGEL